MSRIYYFAADAPLEVCPNPYLELLSVNEALARGHAVNLSVFPDSFDFDRPNVILHATAEDAFDHPNIFSIDPNNFFEDIGTTRRYCAELEWDWCARTAHEVIAYIARQLAVTDAVELWSIWLGSRNIPQTVKRTEMRFAAFTPDTLRVFLQQMSQPFVEGENWCLTIQK